MLWTATLLISDFFFSSRRRHTRLQGDWSSDVCSSDLSIHASKPSTSDQSAENAKTWQRQPARLRGTSALRSLPGSLAPWQAHLREYRSIPAFSPRTLLSPPHWSTHEQTQRLYSCLVHPGKHSLQSR